MTEESQRQLTRREKYQITWLAKLDRLFKGRTFDIMDELHFAPGRAALTVLGHKARHVWVLQDRVTGEKLVVANSTLRHMHERYGAVTRPSTYRRRNLTEEDYS